MPEVRILSTPEKRWISRSLVKILLFERRDYKSAAEVISSSENIFAQSCEEIEAKMDALAADRSVANALALQMVLEKTRAEIEAHTAWEAEVLEELAEDKHQLQEAAPVRMAFAAAAEIRKMVTDIVEVTYATNFSS